MAIKVERISEQMRVHQYKMVVVSANVLNCTQENTEVADPYRIDKSQQDTRNNDGECRKVERVAGVADHSVVGLDLQLRQSTKAM